jgi:hypothetical protein
MPRFLLSRFLLSWKGYPRALSTLLLALSGCVVPIGPEWSNPQSNYPPTIHSANPPIGYQLGGDADGGGSPESVEVVLADQNTADILYVRWIIDYPPFDENSRVALALAQPGGSQILRPSVRYEPNCNDDSISHDFLNHRLLLAVTDRPFASDDLSQPPLDGPSGDYLVEGSWDFVLKCP